MSTNLDLGEGDLKAEALIEVGIQSVLFDRRLLLLESLAVVLQHHLNEGIWESDTTCSLAEPSTKILIYTVIVGLKHASSPDSPPTSIFFRFLASMMLIVNLPAVGTYRREMQISPSFSCCQGHKNIYICLKHFGISV